MSQEKSKQLIVRLGERFGVDARKLFDTLKVTAFRLKNNRAPTDEEMMALLIVADQYGLNPFTKELYAYEKGGAVFPILGIDGWLRIWHEHPAFDGCKFEYAEECMTPPGSRIECPKWIICVMRRKGLTHP